MDGILNRLEEEGGWIHLLSLIETSVKETIKELAKSHTVTLDTPIEELLAMNFSNEETLCEEMLSEKKMDIHVFCNSTPFHTL